MVDVLVGIPYAKVEFATESGNLIIEQKAQIHDKNMDFDILSINTTRDIGSDDCATFDIELVYKDIWYNNIHGNDFVQIDLGRGYKAEPVLFGMVDNVYKSFAYADLKVIRTIRISGRGFNKALIQFGIGAIQEVKMDWGTIGFFPGQDMGFGVGNAAELIQVVFNHFANKGIDMEFANGKHWRDYMATQFIGDPDEMALAKPDSYYTYQGGLWDYIKELRNAPFNEVYWEVMNNKPTFVVRPTPFNPDRWTQLHLEPVQDFDVIDEQLGRTDLETYTVYVVKAEHFVDTMNVVYGNPVWYKHNYRKYGLRRLQINSKYIMIEERPNRAETGIQTPGRNYYNDGADEMGNRVVNEVKNQPKVFNEQFIAEHQAMADAYVESVRNNPILNSIMSSLNTLTGNTLEKQAQFFTDYAKNIIKQADAVEGGGNVSTKTIDLFNWNIKNDRMENGNLTVIGDAKYKIGTRIYTTSNGMEYYLENVSHTFTYNEDWKTTLQLTRGLMPTERFSKPWNQWAVITPEDMIAITGIDPSTTQIEGGGSTTHQSSSGETHGGGGGTFDPSTPSQPSTPTTPGSGGMISPIGGEYRVSSGFGERFHPIYKTNKHHDGIDIPKPKGTPILATMNGTVEKTVYSTSDKGWGTYVVINHGNGLKTLYAHASSLSVKEGQSVKAGDKIGEVGSTGASTGNHLHFEVIKDGKRVDPMDYIK